MQTNILLKSAVFVQILILEYYIVKKSQNPDPMGKFMTGQTLNGTIRGYKHVLQTTEQAIKDIRNQFSQNNSQPVEFMQTQASIILKFMSEPKAYEDAAYAKSMLIIDNLLVLSKELTSCIWLYDQFLSNLSKYFCRICKSNSDQNKVDKYENHLYGCLYLVLLLIYRSNQTTMSKSKLFSHLLTQQFTANFLSLEFEGISVKVIKVISIILAFLVRNKRAVQLKNQTKLMALNLSTACNDQITQAYLVTVFKHICTSINLSQIHKYKLVQFLMTALDNNEGEAVKNSLIVIFHILQRHRVLGDQFLQRRILKYFDKNIKQHPEICFNILRLMLPQVETAKIQGWFWVYFKHIIENPAHVSYFHILIVNDLFKYLPNKHCITLLQTGGMEKLQFLAQSMRNDKFILAINKLKSSFQSKLMEIDANLFKIYQNVRSYQVVQVLDRLS